jgi:Tfp pilus assembly protein PilN
MTTMEIYSSIKSSLAKMRSQAARLGRSLWRILSFSLADDRLAPLQVLSVMLERGGVAVIYASRFLSRIKIRGVRRYFFEKGSYPTPDNVASAVALAANELRAQRAQLILVVPKSWTIVKATDFPLSVADNLSTVISYELDRLTPLAADRAFYDFQIIGRDESRLGVMVAAVNRDILRPYLDALQENKIRVRRIAVSSSALGTLSQHIHGSGGVVFVHISEGVYEGGLIRAGQWQTSFTGKLSAADDQANIQTISEEVNPLIGLIKKEEENIEVIVDDPLSEKWCLRLRDSIQAPVRFIREMDLQLRFFSKEDRKEVPYVALGGVLEHLRPQIPKMDLLTCGGHQIPRTPLALSAALILLIIGLVVFWAASPLQVEEWKAEALDREIAARRNDVKKIELLKKDLQNMEKDLSAISTFKSSRPLVMNLLKEMTSALPKNTWLTRMHIAESIVEIEGYASAATEIVPKLEASKYFKKVEFTSSTYRDPRLNVDRFTIKMEIEGLPEEKLEHGKKK